MLLNTVFSRLRLLDPDYRSSFSIFYPSGFSILLLFRNCLSLVVFYSLIVQGNPVPSFINLKNMQPCCRKKHRTIYPLASNLHPFFLKRQSNSKHMGLAFFIIQVHVEAKVEIAESTDAGTEIQAIMRLSVGHLHINQ